MSAIESHEIERKYAAPQRRAVPSLADLEGVAQVRRRRPVDLDAQYFDTEQLTLLANRITLRKRVGGSDEGWHLKLPGDGLRRELHSELTEDDVAPDALLVYVQAALRGQSLVPAVRLQTRRTVHELLDEDGAVLAEICDDRVQSIPGVAGIEPLAWREWEAELKLGDLSLLDRIEPVLLAVGASPSSGPSKAALAFGDAAPTPRMRPAAPKKKPTVADVAREYLFDEIERLKEHDSGARLHGDDAIHQMRVAARRLRSVLSSYRDMLLEGESQSLRDELKALADSLGGARDAEVVRDRLLGLIDEQPENRILGPIRERISTELDERYERAHDDAMAFMSSQRYFELLARLEHLVDEQQLVGLGDEPAAKSLVHVFDRDWRRLRKAVHHADSLDDQTEHEIALHDVRKAAKRLRYGMDSTVPTLGKTAKRVAKAASAITEILGDHNDSVITSEVIAELAELAHEHGEHTLTYGRIQLVEEQRASLSQDAYREALKNLNSVRFDQWKRI